MGKKIKLVEGCIVEALVDLAAWDPVLEDMKAGMTFQYRGIDAGGTHEFGPDYDRYGRDYHPDGLPGFGLPDEDLEEEVFSKYLRVRPSPAAPPPSTGRRTG